MTDIALWKQTLTFWAANDYRPRSIGKMIEYYEGLENGNHGTNRNYSQKRTDADVIAESADFYANYDEHPIA